MRYVADFGDRAGPCDEVESDDWQEFLAQLRAFGAKRRGQDIFLGVVYDADQYDYCTETGASTGLTWEQTDEAREAFESTYRGGK